MKSPGAAALSAGLTDASDTVEAARSKMSRRIDMQD
jgi:hypothetical protein